MNGHIKAVSRPRVAQIGNLPIDVIVLKGFIVDVLTAFEGLVGRKNPSGT